jgi:hypothetical protein
MADGTTKAIKDVQVDDKVTATDPDTGVTTSESVEALHINQDTDLADVTITTADGQTTVLHTTQHHPFWDDTTKQWADAADLQTGHQLRNSDGSSAGTVTSVRVFTGQHEMRDLTVTTVHTYYVIAGTTPVLVHNCGEATVHLDFSNPEAKHALITIRSDAGEVLSTHQFGSVQNPRAGVETFDATTLKSRDDPECKDSRSECERRHGIRRSDDG